VLVPGNMTELVLNGLALSPTCVIVMEALWDPAAIV
jgi:hypothetical protein